MHAPQIIMIIILTFNVAQHAFYHGQSKEEKYNFFTALFAAGISVAILWWGGFFE